MTFEEQRDLEDQYVMNTFARKPVEFVQGRGMYLEDSEGKTYLDFLSGIGVCSLGHCHPAVVEAITKQTEKLIHVSNYFYIEKRGQVAKQLSDLLNVGLAEEDCLPWRSFFANSGAEANECALKLARLRAKEKYKEAGKNPDEAPSIVVTLLKSFHGRTLATLAATGQRALHVGFEPIPEGFLPTPINDIDALEQIFQRMGHSICAIMLEPIQGESGVNLCTAEFLKAARRLCDEHDTLLIFDEVQCGIFRTGRPFAFQHFGVVPDVVTIAKGIASGVPAGACAARGDAGQIMRPGQHGSTFGGSNLAMSAAHATLEELSKPDVALRVEEVGAYMREHLACVRGVIGVRGMGLMNAVELAEEYDAHQVVSAALAHKLVINATGPHTLRFLPPLICKTDHVDEFCEKLQAALDDVLQGTIKD